MANTFKFGNGNWAVKDGSALAYNDENNNFKPLPFDFTRASSATTLNRQGLIETVGSGKPRIDFLNNTKGHLLLEPSRSNLATYSEGFSNWSIISSGVVVTDNTTDVLSPSGKNDASKVEFNAASKILGQSPTLSGNYSGFVYVKGTQGETIRFNFGGTEENFTLTGGWDKLERTNITATANAFNLNTYGGATARTIYVYGAQLESGSYPTSYIPTEGSSVTRVVETTNATVPSGVFGTSEGTIYAEGVVAVEEGVGQMPFTAGTDAANLIYVWIQANGRLMAESYTSSLQCNISSSIGILSVGDSYKIAFGYANNDFVLYLNGTQIGTDTNGSIAVPSNVKVGGYIASGYEGGKIKQTKIYDTRLTNTELQNLTT